MAKIFNIFFVLLVILAAGMGCSYYYLPEGSEIGNELFGQWQVEIVDAEGQSVVNWEEIAELYGDQYEPYSMSVVLDVSPHGDRIFLSGSVNGEGTVDSEGNIQMTIDYYTLPVLIGGEDWGPYLFYVTPEYFDLDPEYYVFEGTYMPGSYSLTLTGFCQTAFDPVEYEHVFQFQKKYEQ